MKNKILKTISILPLFLIGIFSSVFASSITEQFTKDFNRQVGSNYTPEEIITGLKYLMSEHPEYIVFLGVIILIIYIVICCLYIPYMKKIHQPIWKVFVPGYNEYVVYNAGGGGLGIVAIVGPILLSLFLQYPASTILPFLATAVLNVILAQKFTNYKGNYLAYLWLILFGPIAIGFGNHQYKG